MSLIKERYYTAYSVSPINEHSSMYTPVETLDIPEHLRVDILFNRHIIDGAMNELKVKHEAAGEYIVVLTEEYPGQFEGV